MPATQSVPEATHWLLAQQPPPAQVPFGQQAPPSAPHATHMPFVQFAPAPHMLPGQHAWPAMPHIEHMLLATHTGPPPQGKPVGTQVLLVAQQPPLQVLLAQQG
jgi:hypothetical protein